MQELKIHFGFWTLHSSEVTGNVHIHLCRPHSAISLIIKFVDVEFKFVLGKNIFFSRYLSYDKIGLAKHLCVYTVCAVFIQFQHICCSVLHASCLHLYSYVIVQVLRVKKMSYCVEIQENVQFLLAGCSDIFTIITALQPLQLTGSWPNVSCSFIIQCILINAHYYGFALLSIMQFSVDNVICKILSQTWNSSHYVAPAAQNIYLINQRLVN